MTTEELVDGHLHCGIFCIHLLGLIFQGCSHVHATSRTDNHLAFRFVIEIEENVTLQNVGLHMVHAIHCGLLVGCDEAFDGAVLERVVLHDSHDCGHSHTIIGAERSALGLYPFTVDVGLDGVRFKVVGGSLFLLRNHVHVALKSHILAVLHARRGRFAHDDVSSFVLKGFNALFLGP